MRAVHFRVFVLVVVYFFVVMLGGCDEENVVPEVEMVTISGIVRSIETGMPAPGIKVSLFTDMTFADDVATGSDGAYIIEVPKNSRIWLQTDDFSPIDEVYIPTINVDIPAINASSDITDWSIHCCPWSSPPGRGSVAIWDDYLANCDDVNYGDIYPALSSEQSGGIVAVLFTGCEAGQMATYDGISVSFGSAMAPVSYVDENVVQFDQEGYPVSTDCNIFYAPGARDMTDSMAWAHCFVDPAFGGDRLTITITDNDASRGLVFATPIDIPVAPGTLTLLLPGVIDGVTGATFKELCAECWCPSP